MGWLWYGVRTPKCVPLDRDAYPETVYDGQLIPWPPWACKAPDGGVHYNASLASIDIAVASKPRGRYEFGWNCDFQVFLLRRSWFSRIEDLVEASDRVGHGRLFLKGEPLDDWATIHGRRPPPLTASEGWTKVCPICGRPYTLMHGRVFFSDPAVRDMPLIVNGAGIFVREDEVRRRNLPPPLGAYKPRIVRLEMPGEKRAARPGRARP